MSTKLDTFTQADLSQHFVSIDQSGDHAELDQAILKTLAYADVFDYPLTGEQLHRYLIGVQVPSHHLHAVLNNGYLTASQVSRASGFYTLAGRESIVEIRVQRSKYSTQLWAKARSYGNLIARLPFVRMVAVTGALAMNNARPGKSLPREALTGGLTGARPGSQYGDDIDYLIVTVPGRLWLCRAMIIALVRLAALRGDIICPNYFLTGRALVFYRRTLYTAHELTQMVPLSGRRVYERIRKLNTWANSFLPNAIGPPSNWNAQDLAPLFPFAESMPLSPIASWLEEWEMKRKVQRFQVQIKEGDEVSFCEDWCKGHFDGHGDKTMKAFAARLGELGIADTEPNLGSDR
jgi:hypothetical protein